MDQQIDRLEATRVETLTCNHCGLRTRPRTCLGGHRRAGGGLWCPRCGERQAELRCVRRS
jgi:hypothetical protein